ncbi:MAG: hypothetical protein LQ351_004243 [Letrouitia transgressa]|nr:MAG: hypothetical protein LQ351_004243 [Letrouitia transgressa]
MPAVTFPSLTDDQIDDLLYLARTNSLSDLRETVSTFSKSQNTSSHNILLATIDRESGNSLLHMTSANGCMGSLISLITTHPSPFANTKANLLVILRRSQLPSPPFFYIFKHAVKALIGAGADPAIRNGTGHDAVYEAEVGGKDEVVSWLLKEGEGLEKGVVGDHVKEERDGEDADKESAADGVERVAEGADGADGAQRAVEEAEKGLTDLRFKEQN